MSENPPSRRDISLQRRFSGAKLQLFFDICKFLRIFLQKRRETAGKQPKEGIPPEVNSKKCRIVSGETTKKENPHQMRGQMDGEDCSGRQYCSGRQPRKVDRCGRKRGKERSVNVRRSLRTKDLHPIAANGAHKASMNSRIVPP